MGAGPGAIRLARDVSKLTQKGSWWLFYLICEHSAASIRCNPIPFRILLVLNARFRQKRRIACHETFYRYHILCGHNFAFL